MGRVIMGKKMFILEMERGKTECKSCPFSFYDSGDYVCCNEDFTDKIKCLENDLSTINVRELFDKDSNG